MKKNYLLTIMPFLIACSTESIQSDKVVNAEKNYLKTGTQYPDNIDNEFDTAGRLHNQLSESYVISGKIPTSLFETVTDIETIAFQNELFVQLNTQEYSTPSIRRLEDILERPVANMTTIISNSNISTKAKASITMFISHIMILESINTSYEDIYEYIVAYEEDIVRDNSYNQRDHKILLVTSSITRHASYFAKIQKKKPRDKDWDLVIANIIAAIEGAEEGIATAATMAATAGIISNY